MATGEVAASRGDGCGQARVAVYAPIRCKPVEPSPPTSPSSSTSAGKNGSRGCPGVLPTRASGWRRRAPVGRLAADRLHAAALDSIGAAPFLQVRQRHGRRLYTGRSALTLSVITSGKPQRRRCVTRLAPVISVSQRQSVNGNCSSTRCTPHGGVAATADLVCTRTSISQHLELPRFGGQGLIRDLHRCCRQDVDLIKGREWRGPRWCCHVRPLGLVVATSRGVR